jgi:hypothetical protein
MNEEARLQFSAIKARSQADLLTFALVCLRTGERDSAMQMFESDLECQNIAKALEYLKRRQRPLALEALETELDQRIVVLGALPDTLEPGDREKVTESLRSIRDYRRENPRKFEADLGYFNNESLAKTRALWDRAEKILNEIR